MRVPLAHQHMAVEASHFLDGENADAAMCWWASGTRITARWPSSMMGKALFEVFKFLGVKDIAYNRPASLPYPTENPFA